MNSYFLILIIINIVIFINYKNISRIYNIYDIPDQLRKKHKKPTPLLGGPLIIVNLFFYCFFEYFETSNMSYFNNKLDILIFLLCSLFFFMVGFIDDKKNLKPNLKLLLYIIIILLLSILDNDLVIKNINFTFTEYIFHFYNFSYIFTILCFLLFINSFNMLDGINGQAGCYAIFISLLMIFLNINIIFFVGLIILMLIFLYFNFKEKMFLGDSGSILLSFLISYFFIKSYNKGIDIYSDEIFLIMMIPGLELLRLALQRLYEKKHPFSPDSKHIHHLLLNKTSFFNSFIWIQILLIFPFIFYLLISNSFISFILSLIVYICLIFKLSNNEN